MVKLCRTLGAHAPLPALVHQLVFVVRSDGNGATVPRKEALWVLAHALDGAGARAAADAADAETRAQIEAERREAGDEEAAEEEEEGEEGEGRERRRRGRRRRLRQLHGLGEEARGRGPRRVRGRGAAAAHRRRGGGDDAAVLLLLDLLPAPSGTARPTSRRAPSCRARARRRRRRRRRR